MKPLWARTANRWDERQVSGTKLWLPGSVLLFAALAAYCEVCTVIAGLPRPGIAVSAPWALQITAGWAIVGAVLGTYGERLIQVRVVRAWPLSSAAIAVFAIAAFALASEMAIAAVRGDEPELLRLLGARGPMSLAGSTLAVALLGLRRFVPRRGVSELEVMTGTGYVTIATADIESLEADGNYLSVTHASGRTYLLRSTMSAAERMLGRQFVRVHRSVIVNRSRIQERRSGGLLMLQSGRAVRIGRAFRDRLA